MTDRTSRVITAGPAADLADDGPASRGGAPTVVTLDGRPEPISVVGGKGAALDRLVAWGLPVPPSGAVTVAGYRRFTRDPAVEELIDQIAAGRLIGGEDVDRVFLATPMDPAMGDAIVLVARSIGGGARLAVRSSATVEDLERSSFAGQYRSFLEIDPEDRDSLLRAVRLVFASLWHPAPCSYRRAFGISTGGVGMAAVLMRMVDARRAGVAFSVDPSGSPDMARIESVDGLAESLVSGQETPNAFLLPRRPVVAASAEVARHERTRAAHRTDAVAAPEEQRPVPPELDAVLELALRVEHLSGRPQDIEWAWDGERVWLVQARPITMLGPGPTDEHDDLPAVLDGLDLTTAGIDETLPGVLPPLVWDVTTHLVEEAFANVLSTLGETLTGVKDRRWLLRRVRGRAAMDFGRLRSMTAGMANESPEGLEAAYFGGAQHLVGGPATDAGTSEGPGGEPATKARATAHRHSRLRSFRHDLRVLRAHRSAQLDAEVAILAAEAIADAAPPFDGLSDRGLLGYQLRLLDLGVRAMTAELGVAAAATASYQRLERALVRHFGAADGPGLARRLTSGGTFAAARALASAGVFAGPTWAELGGAPPTPHDIAVPDRDAVLEEAWRVRGRRGSGPWAAMREHGLRRLADDTAGQLLRRERAKAAVLLLGGEVRRVHHTCGERLAERGRIDATGDVELFTLAELRRALLDDGAPGPTTGPTIGTLTRRRRWLARHADEHPLPVRFHGEPADGPRPAPAGDRLQGWAASPGRFTGRVQVLHRSTDHLDRDGVLVAEATDPSWSPVFLRAGAIVLERGGPLSHAAILARELGIPAVLNVPGATAALDGRIVHVDGDRGLVVIAADPPPATEA